MLFVVFFVATVAIGASFVVVRRKRKGGAAAAR